MPLRKGAYQFFKILLSERGGGGASETLFWSVVSTRTSMEGVSCLGLSLRFDITLIVEQLFPTCSGGQSGCIVCYYVRWYDRSRPPVIPARSKLSVSKYPSIILEGFIFPLLFVYINQFLKWSPSDICSLVDTTIGLNLLTWAKYELNCFIFASI